MQRKDISDRHQAAVSLGAAMSIGLLATTLAACGIGSAELPSPGTPSVPVASPVTDLVNPTHQYPARLEAINRVELRARVSGYVDEVGFAEGSFISKDQVLLRIDPRPYRLRLDQADSALELAHSDLTLAASELERARRLAARDAISTQDLDRRTAALAGAQARFNVARATREAAALELSFTQITSPISGRIGRALVSKGNLVTGGAEGGTLLAVAVSTDPLYVSFDIDEQVAASVPVSPDNSVTVEFSPANSISPKVVGELAFLDNELGHGTGTLRARARIPNPEGTLVPGMLGKAIIILPTQEVALLVDEKAIATDQGQRYVLIVGEDAKVEYRPVKLGPRAGPLRIIEDGLSGKEMVIVNGLMQVRPGSSIQPYTVSMERAAANDYTPLPLSPLLSRKGK